MDESVKRALAKWPNVPDCYDWLKLDRRGQWVMRAPDADPPVWGPILHEKLIDFIHRNYFQDEDGSYIFQNGPQKVRVELAYTPYVFHVPGGEISSFCLEASSGQPAEEISGVWIDETGSVVVNTEIGAGVIDDRDLGLVSEWITDRDGSPVEDDKLAAQFEHYMLGKPSGLYLNGLEIQFLRSEDAEGEFAYVRVPTKPS